MRLLVIDVGNTTTRVGLWDGRGAVEHVVANTAEVRAGEVAPADLVARVEGAGGPVEGVALASVVPEAEAPWEEWAFGRRIELLDLQGDTPAPVSNRYAQPGRLGVDRLCAAVGAAGRLGAPVIVAMLGTATVIDAVSARKAFLGGAIAAGVETGLRALNVMTATLPQVLPEAPPAVIGTDTESSLLSGAVLGAAALVEGLVRRMQEALGALAPVALTGGLAELIAPHLRLPEGTECRFFPALVLEGAGMMWEYNCRV